jgi:2-phosphosulfolactate phosphatase
MNISLTLERSYYADVSIMVDVLRASTTITTALESFAQVIPTRNIGTAQKLSQKTGTILAGERGGAKIRGFDVGNSPVEISDLNGECLILTTSNGTRILENMNGKILIGSFINASKVAENAKKLAKNSIEVVMAGVNGQFVIEDFLGAGEIISYLTDHELDEMAQASCLAVQNENKTNQAVINSRSAKNLEELGYEKDISFCLQRNRSEIVPVFDNGIIKPQK